MNDQCRMILLVTILDCAGVAEHMFCSETKDSHRMAYDLNLVFPFSLSGGGVATLCVCMCVIYVKLRRCNGGLWTEFEVLISRDPPRSHSSKTQFSKEQKERFTSF